MSMWQDSPAHPRDETRTLQKKKEGEEMNECTQLGSGAVMTQLVGLLTSWSSDWFCPRLQSAAARSASWLKATLGGSAGGRRKCRPGVTTELRLRLEQRLDGSVALYLRHALRPSPGSGLYGRSGAASLLSQLFLQTGSVCIEGEVTLTK